MSTEGTGGGPPRRKGWGTRLLNLVSDEVPDEHAESGTPVTEQTSEVSSVTRTAPARRPTSTSTVDPVALEEVRKGIESRSPSDVLDEFVEQVQELTNDPDFRAESARFKAALRIVAKSQDMKLEDVLDEIERVLNERLQAVSQERQVGEAEIRRDMDAELKQTTTRLTAIRTTITDLRTQIGQLQQEETELSTKEAGVQRKTDEAIGKLGGACDAWVNQLQTTLDGFSRYLRPRPVTPASTTTAKKEGEN